MKCLVVVLTLYNSIQFDFRWPTWGIYSGLFIFLTEEFHPSSTRNFSHWELNGMTITYEMLTLLTDKNKKITTLISLFAVCWKYLINL